MGFISIFGIAVQDALIVVTYAQRLWAEGHSVEDGALLAAERRLRPVLMTTSVAMLGLMPAALSHGIGSETQTPAGHRRHRRGSHLGGGASPASACVAGAGPSPARGGART